MNFSTSFILFQSISIVLGSSYGVSQQSLGQTVVQTTQSPKGLVAQVLSSVLGGQTVQQIQPVARVVQPTQVIQAQPPQYVGQAVPQVVTQQTRLVGQQNPQFVQTLPQVVTQPVPRVINQPVPLPGQVIGPNFAQEYVYANGNGNGRRRKNSKRESIPLVEGKKIRKINNEVEW